MPGRHPLGPPHPVRRPPQGRRRRRPRRRPRGVRASACAGPHRRRRPCRPSLRHRHHRLARARDRGPAPPRFRRPPGRLRRARPRRGHHWVATGTRPANCPASTRPGRPSHRSDRHQPPVTADEGVQARDRVLALLPAVLAVPAVPAGRRASVAPGFSAAPEARPVLAARGVRVRSRVARPAPEDRAPAALGRSPVGASQEPNLLGSPASAHRHRVGPVARRARWTRSSRPA